MWHHSSVPVNKFNEEEEGEEEEECSTVNKNSPESSFLFSRRYLSIMGIVIVLYSLCCNLSNQWTAVCLAPPFWCQISALGTLTERWPKTRMVQIIYLFFNLPSTSFDNQIANNCVLYHTKLHCTARWKHSFRGLSCSCPVSLSSLAYHLPSQ